MMMVIMSHCCDLFSFNPDPAVNSNPLVEIGILYARVSRASVPPVCSHYRLSTSAQQSADADILPQAYFSNSLFLNHLEIVYLSMHQTTVSSLRRLIPSKCLQG